MVFIPFQMSCGDDEITAMDVSSDFIVIQYFLEPGIDVYDTETKAKLYRLEGHEYGGQCVKIMSVGSDGSSILFSGSNDKTLRAWNIS